MKTLFLTILLSFLLSQQTQAKDLMVQGRLFIANTKINPTELNSALSNEGMKTIDKTFNFGVEITFPTFRFIEPGMRYTRRLFTAEENPANSQTNYEMNGSQNSILFLARIPFIHTSFLRFDVFGGVGGNNTTVKLKTAQSDGEWKKAAVGDWFATPYYAYGGSVGFGIHSVLLYAEAGYESNKVNKLQASGTLHSTVSSLNLSGNYFMIGLMFDGVKGYKK